MRQLSQPQPGTGAPAFMRSLICVLALVALATQSAWAAQSTALAFPFLDGFSDDLGWHATQEGIWERRVAMGSPVGSPPNDTSAGDDRRVLSTRLSQSGPLFMSSAYRVISPAIDCSAQRLVELSYQRWLQIDSSDWAQAEVAVSVDGASWNTLWSNGPNGVQDASWQQVRFDITELAAGQPAVYISFSLGPLYNAEVLSGWHIDDVRLDTGVQDCVLAKVAVNTTNCVQGDLIEVQILLKEQVPGVSGLRGATFNLNYDPAGFELVSTPSAASIVVSPFNQVQNTGQFGPGKITGLGGVTLTDGVGKDAYAEFARLQFRALKTGAFLIGIEPGDAGCVLPPPMGPINKGRVRCDPSVAVSVAPAPPVFPLAIAHRRSHKLGTAGRFIPDLRLGQR